MFKTEAPASRGDDVQAHLLGGSAQSGELMGEELGDGFDPENVVGLMFLFFLGQFQTWFGFFF